MHLNAPVQHVAVAQLGESFQQLLKLLQLLLKSALSDLGCSQGRDEWVEVHFFKRHNHTIWFLIKTIESNYFAKNSITFEMQIKS